MTNYIIGYHQGLHNYTIGQRQGIKVGAGGPYFVCGKDLKHNRLYVTNDPNDERLMVKEVEIHSVNWLTPPTLPPPQGGRSKEGVDLLGRYRHQGELVQLAVRKIKNDLYRVVFRKPQKAVASGQSLVLYRGKECLGGGVIV
jgi:tRNA-specific 2-thiouridylase